MADNEHRSPDKQHRSPASGGSATHHEKSRGDQDQGVVRDDRQQEQPADADRAQERQKGGLNRKPSHHS